jgi:ElaB/YqjD/DUF883 family membrane-anchored ribosome-binding protein
MSEPTELELAQARIAETRAKLFATVGDIQDRLRPSNIAQDMVESATHSVATVARRGAEAVRTRPLATAAIAGTIGLVMARGWIGDIIGNRSKTHETPKAPDRSKPRATRAKKGTA